MVLLGTIAVLSGGKEPPKKKPKSMTATAIEFMKAVDSCQTTEEVDESAEAWMKRFRKKKLEKHAGAYIDWRRAFVTARAAGKDMEEFDPEGDETLSAEEMKLVEQITSLQKKSA